MIENKAEEVKEKPKEEIKKEPKVEENKFIPKIDPSKLNRIQYNGNFFFNNDIDAKEDDDSEGEESEAVYETESSQNKSNFVLGFQK